MKYTVTTYNTKKALAESLKRIMKTKPFSKVTVSEIIQDCGVNRKTFYYHFEDIYALLKWVFDEEAMETVKNFNMLTDHMDAIYFIMDYVEKNDYIVNCVNDSAGRDELKRFFCTDLMSIITSVINESEEKQNSWLDPEFKEYVAGFYTEAISCMLINWAKNKDKLDKDKVVEYLTTIIGFVIGNMEKHITLNTKLPPEI